MSEAAEKRTTKTGPQYCCVVGCHNNSRDTQGKEPPVKFYRFPREWYHEERRRAWITAVRRVNPDGTPWEPKEWTRICSHHFVDNCKNDKADHPAYIPTVFPPEYTGAAPDPGAAKKAPGPKIRPQYCCVVGCHNHSKNTQEPPVKFYRFPSKVFDEERRRAWIRAVRRVNPDGTPWEPKKWTTICSHHFVDNCKNDSAEHPSYIPTVFPPEYTKAAPDPGAAKKSPDPIGKAERCRKRSKEATPPKGLKGAETNLPQCSSGAAAVPTPKTPNDVQLQEQHNAGANDTFPELDASQPARSGDSSPTSASASGKILESTDAACQTEEYCIHGTLTFFLSAITGVDASTQVAHMEQSDKATTTDRNWKRKCGLSGFDSQKENEEATQHINGPKKRCRTVSAGSRESARE
ncbi:uncharacterized protein LOC144158770 [Haemaphysalis longicornis]